MNRRNVRVIFAREILDQLRDRRTMFMIFVLPLMLYPVLGISFYQLAQFVRQKPSRILVVGAETLRQHEDYPPLFANGHLSPTLFDDPREAELFTLEYLDYGEASGLENQDDALARARHRVEEGDVDAALVFSKDFGARLSETCCLVDQPATPGPPVTPPEVFGNGEPTPADGEMEVEELPTVPSEERPASGGEDTAAGVEDEGEPRLVPVPSEVSDEAPGDALSALFPPDPTVIHSTASEESQFAYGRLSGLLRQWVDQIALANVEAAGLSTRIIRPFGIDTSDVAQDTLFKGAALWAKLLPVVLMLWTLTGAFYPAVDLCAGEKERGTLETLLSGPAERSEIVVGKILTVMLFSMATATLNIISLALTGLVVVAQLPQQSPPSLAAIALLLVAMVPVAALFSALCVALAAFARSTKEGQYYLVPLFLIGMPLIVMPMAPGVDLNLGMALVPVSNLVLLLREFIAGNASHALRYVPVVLLVTGGCCWMAIRWAVDQFRSEQVIFRASERFDLALWWREFTSHRHAIPTLGMAVFCAVGILLLQFFANSVMFLLQKYLGLLGVVALSQLIILLPPLLITVYLIGDVKRTYRLRMPPLTALGSALLLPLVLFPAAEALQRGIMELYPPSPVVLETLELLSGMTDSLPLWGLLVAMALVPAVCEEATFRGFLLSGLSRPGRTVRAVVLTALVFGLVHTILQQSLNAMVLGLLLGYLAVRSGSIWPSFVMHLVHNGLRVALTRVDEQVLAEWPPVAALFGPDGQSGFLRTTAALVLSLVVGAATIGLFHIATRGRRDP